jgi:hypothetical protein
MLDYTIIVISAPVSFTNRISRPFTCPQTFINLSPYEGFTKYVAAFVAKIQQSVNRFVGDEDPKVRLCEEFFLKAL